jgi:tRNA threonylcarbamoyladenosine biosynthesis protein TsaB
MSRLALDTSSNACSVALEIDGQVIEKHVVEPRAHTAILMSMIKAVVNDSGTRLSDLDAIVLGNGPGSFIGMRIGASVVQGLCHAAGIGVIPVSSLAAVAAEAVDKHGAEHVLVAQDAHMKEVYLGSFTAAGGLPVAECEEQICAVGPLSGYDRQFVAAGDGWNRYPGLLADNSALVSRVLPVAYPRAQYLLKIAAGCADPALDPAALKPAYLRMKVAEPPGTRS